MKFIVGSAMMVLYLALIWHMFVNRPNWMKTWNIKSKLVVIFALPWFFVALGLMLSVKA